MPERKYIRRAKDKLKARKDAYNQTVKDRTDNGKGFRIPGSLKMKRN